MKTLTMFLQVASAGETAQNQNHALNNTTGYTIGLIIGMIILGYLVYTLFKPEKFWIHAKYLLLILSYTFSFLLMDTTATFSYPDAGLFSKVFILLKFFGGIVLLFGIGIIIGKLMKLNRYIK